MMFTVIYFFAHVDLGVDQTFIIAPNNIIVGNVHGYKEKVCMGDKSIPTKARECFPQGKYDFKWGQVIDFTWGMTGDQEGNLVYAIMKILHALASCHSSPFSPTGS